MFFRHEISASSSHIIDSLNNANGLEDSVKAILDLRAAGAPIHLSSDKQIYGEGDNAGLFYKVVTGVVRTCKFSSDGRRQIDAFYVAGEIFGFELGWEHTLTAETVVDCVIIPFKRRATEPSESEAMSQQLFSHAMHSFTRAQHHVLLLGLKSASEKLCVFLFDWAERTPSGYVVNLRMSRQDIADYLSLTIETVSRCFSQLERDKIIEMTAVREIKLIKVAAFKELLL